MIGIYKFSEGFKLYDWLVVLCNYCSLQSFNLFSKNNADLQRTSKKQKKSIIGL